MRGAVSGVWIHGEQFVRDSHLWKIEQSRENEVDIGCVMNINELFQMISL